MRTLSPTLQPSCCSPWANAATRPGVSGSSAAKAMSAPTRRMRSACCTRAASGHAAAAPPMSVMKSRRLMSGPEWRLGPCWLFPVPPTQTIAQRWKASCIAGFRSGLGQRRVKSAGSNRGKCSYGSTCASCEMKTASDLGRRFVHLRERDVVALERDRTDALARRGKVRVEHGRCGDADRRLADAAPETARRHEDRFDLRHLGDAHHVVAVEVLLLDASVLDRAAALEQRGQPVGDRARNLPFDLGRIDCVSRVGGGNDAGNFDLVA